MTSIVLNGALGNMGRSVIDVVKNKKDKFNIVCAVDVFNNETQKYDFTVTNTFPEKICADAIIDFSHPSSLENLLSFAKKNKTPLVIATTGFSSNDIEKIKNLSKDIPIFFTFNMSIGINLLINLVKSAYKTLKQDFDIEIVEKHHNKKIDAPSGTALMIADAINEEANLFYKYIYNRQSLRKKREKNEIGIHSIRAGSIVGEHEVIFSGVDETVTISHCATSKNVFAIGALKAAEFIKNNPPGLYDMKDLVGQ